jgi:hypothetical protein
MLNGQWMPKPKTNEEIRDHNEGVELSRTLHDFKKNRSRRSKKFFQALRKNPKIAAIVQESEDLANEWHTRNPKPKINVFDRMQHIRSFEFAQQQAEKLAEQIGKII